MSVMVCSKELLLILFLSIPTITQALDWHVTELHFQHGNLAVPEFAGDGYEKTFIITLQHASGWKYGDNFFFIDYIEDEFGIDDNFYGEVYLNFSYEKIFKRDIKFGIIDDIGLVLGYNEDDEANVKKYLPGVRLAFNIHGFTFANLDITAYIDDSEGVSSGGAPRESDSWHANFSWQYPFAIGRSKFSFEGHIEYIDDRRNEFGDEASSWVLAQPQFRYDLGYALLGQENKLFVGTEYQYWNNKLSDRRTDESVFQALVVWRF